MTSIEIMMVISHLIYNFQVNMTEEYFIGVSMTTNFIFMHLVNKTHILTASGTFILQTEQIQKCVASSEPLNSTVDHFTQ